MPEVAAQTGIRQLNLDYLFTRIYDFLTGTHDLSGVVEPLRTFWDAINFISIFLVPLLLFGIVYALVRVWQLHREEHEKFEAEVRGVSREERGSKRWRNIVELTASDNPAEWRHGVMDADVMLDELLTERGYVGESLGEKLKAVPRGALNSLDDAWEAHKVRNEIAHAGSDFILTQREARRVIDLYRSVFEEWDAL